MKNKLKTIIYNIIPTDLVDIYYLLKLNIKYHNLIIEKGVRIKSDIKSKGPARINYGCDIKSPLNLGKMTYINSNCRLYGEGEIFIGNYSSIGYNVSIYSENHNFKEFTSFPWGKEDSK